MSNKGRYVRKLDKRRYRVELMSDKKWYVTDITDSMELCIPSLTDSRVVIFSTIIKSVDESRVRNAARWKYNLARKSDQSLPPLNPSPNTLVNRELTCATPTQSLLTSWKKADELKLKYYVGKSCKKHPDNNIRYTTSSGCVICCNSKYKDMNRSQQ